MWLEQFWSRVDQTGGPDACWPWTGTTKSSGYGVIKRAGRLFRVHIVAYEITTGIQIVSPVVVRHTCDNPPCCNPRHLLAGTKRDNTRDAIERGRFRWPTHAKVTVEQVREIRASSKSTKELAEQYGMSRSGMHKIRAGLTWPGI